MEMQVKWYLAAVWAGLSVLFGPPFGLVIGLLVLLMCLDVLAALVANGKAGKVNPEAGAYGWRRKMTTVILLVALAVLWRAAEQGAGIDLRNVPAPATAAGVFAVFEFLSVLRNARKTGALPPVMDRLFENLEGQPAPPLRGQEG